MNKWRNILKEKTNGIKRKGKTKFIGEVSKCLEKQNKALGREGKCQNTKVWCGGGQRIKRGTKGCPDG